MITTETAYLSHQSSLVKWRKSLSLHVSLICWLWMMSHVIQVNKLTTVSFSNKPFMVFRLVCPLIVTVSSSLSWTQAFLKRSAWCLGMRKVSWLSPTLTWSAALTAPSRSCRLQPPALCSALFGPGVGLPGPGAHYCTTAEDQAYGDDISMAKAAGQGFVKFSHIHWPCPPGWLFLKCIFFSFPKPRSWKLKNKRKKKKQENGQIRKLWQTRMTFFLDLGNKTRNKPWGYELFSCFYCLFLQLGFIFLRRMH